MQIIISYKGGKVNLFLPGSLYRNKTNSLLYRVQFQVIEGKSILNCLDSCKKKKKLNITELGKYNLNTLNKSRRLNHI